jgi:hypothetical protein
MVLTRIDSVEKAQRRADEDEAVRSGLLAVRVRPWRVVTRDQNSTPPAQGCARRVALERLE